jgi:hypothetical protein
MKKLFLVFAILAIAAAPALARSIAGSYINLIEPVGPVTTTFTYTFDFYVWNGSTDAEWITQVWIDFPDSWEIVAGTDSYIPDPGAAGPWAFTFSGGGTDVADWWDASGGYGEIYGGEGGHFYIDVYIGTWTVGEATIHWHLQGDIYGAEPHFLNGQIQILVEDVTPAEDASWSKVKGLY